MAIDFGIVKPGRTLYVPFDSFAGSTGASVTLTGLAVTDIEIYKDGGTTQRASDNGYTLLDTDGIDFDGITGIHGFSINLADNSDAGFYASGSRYFVVVSSVTVDSQTVSFVACTFSIGQPDAVLNTTIATLASQTSFTLTAGPAEDDALNDCWLIIHDVASAVQMASGIVADYTGSTKTVTLAAAPTFTIAATDNIAVMGPMPVQPATAGRKPVVDSAGLVDANTVKVGPTGSGTAQTAGDLAALINAVDDYVDTEVAAIKAKTDNLPSDPADASDIASAFSTVNSTLSTIAAYIDTEVAAIKAKTDNLPSDPADQSAVEAAIAATESALTTLINTVDTVVDAIKVKTDQLGFTNTNKVDAAVLAANDFATAVAQKIAHILLRRTMANTEAASDGDTVNLSSLYGLVQMLQEASLSGNTLTVKQTDGSTTLGTKTVTTDANADPITSVS